MFGFSKLTGALVAAGTVLGGPIGGAIGYGISKVIDKSSSSSSSNSSNNLCYGDVICISRGMYKHFGVYCSDSTVIHYTSLSSDIASDNEILETDLKTFKRDGTGVYKLIFPEKYGAPEHVLTNGFRQNDFDHERMMRLIQKCANYHLYTPDETVNRARSKVGEKKYNLITNNCEHFAIWCKTGISESRQIDAWLDSNPFTDVRTF